MRTARIGILLLLAALLLVVPSAALAVDAGEPEMMEDPIEAMEPEVDVAEPAQPVVPGADDAAAQGGAMPQADGFENGIADTAAPGAEAGARGATATATATAAPASPVASGSGQLPFTGLDSRQLLQLFLVGSVLLSGGIVSLAWAGARTGAAPGAAEPRRTA